MDPSQIQDIEFPLFSAPGWMSNAHFQTMVASRKPRRWDFGWQSWEPLEMDLGPEGKLLAEASWQPGTLTDHPAVFLLHGLEGSTRSHYLIGMSRKSFAAGFHTVRVNTRNCGGTEHLTPTLYRAGFFTRGIIMAPELQVHPIPSNLDLELPAGAMRELVGKALERIVDHISSLPGQPSADVEGCEALARSLVEPLPERPTEYAVLLDLLFKELVPKSFNTAGPGYLAYIPGGGLFHSAVADLISDAVNRYVGVWIAAPGLAQLEANVIRWFSAIVGYPEEARGILTTGGSLANFTALVTARRNLLPDDFLSGTLYASDQVHHSVVKAAMLAGFPAGNVREIATDDRYRIRLDHLESSIGSDRRNGLRPFLVVGNAGTTNTGAVDDLDGLADIAERESIWLHIDAAYGGFFMLTGKGRQVMRGIERSHSITLDPHKGLFLPYGTGSLLVRDGDALRRAHAVDASYLPPMQQDPDLVDFCLYSPELSRDFRGLRVWLPIKMHGIEPFRRNLEEKLALADWAAEQLRSIPLVEIVAEPQLSLVAFRVAHPGWDTGAENDFNRRLMREVNARKRVYLTGTILRGKFVIRICVLSFRTHFDRMKAALEDIRAALRDLS